MTPPFVAETEAADGAGAAAGAQTLATAVFQRLREDILRGRFQPGARLRMDTLREMYGAGGSPLREALSRLSSDGLVVTLDQRGFRVAQVSRADLEDLVSTRIWADATALRTSIQHADDTWEAAVVGAHHRLARFKKSADLDPLVLDEELEARHRAFHVALVSGCGSRRLIDYSNLLYDQADRYRRLAYAHGARGRDLATEHQGLLAAVMDRDADRAAREIEIHYDRTKTSVLAVFATQAGWPERHADQ